MSCPALCAPALIPRRAPQPTACAHAQVNGKKLVPNRYALVGRVCPTAARADAAWTEQPHSPTPCAHLPTCLPARLHANSTVVLRFMAPLLLWAVAVIVVFGVSFLELSNLQVCLGWGRQGH